MSHLGSLEMFVIFKEALGRGFYTQAWDTTLKKIGRVDLVVMGIGGGASCPLCILELTWRVGKFHTGDTEQGAAAETSEADRAPIPVRLAVPCQCLRVQQLDCSHYLKRGGSTQWRKW